MSRTAVLAVGLLALTACSPRAVVVGEADAGSTVAVEPGQELRVELSENASVGYTWDLTTAPDPVVLVFVGREYEGEDTEGGGGIVTFRFTGTGPGTTRIVLSRDYRGEGVDRTIELEVEVEPR